jgi:hypothetical protein
VERGNGDNATDNSFIDTEAKLVDIKWLCAITLVSNCGSGGMGIKRPGLERFSTKEPEKENSRASHINTAISILI